MNNTRYTVAIHILTLLAYCGPEPLTSEFIAGSVNTNPVVIRRILASLRTAGLVRSQGGPGGGWQLLKDPDHISLRDVLVALEEAPLFPLHSADPNILCPVGKAIQSLLTGHFRAAQEALEKDLDRTTIFDLVAGVNSPPQ